MSRAFIAGWRFGLVTAVLVVAFAVVLVRLYYLHVVAGKELAAIAEGNRSNVVVLHGKRGDIVDRRGNLLATTRPVYELGVDPQCVLPEERGKWAELARLIGRPLPELEKSMCKLRREVAGPYGREVRLVRWQKLAEAVDDTTYERVQELGIKGVYGNRKFLRHYPGDSLAAHVLGFVNKGDQAVTGVERGMDFYLGGQDGWRETENDGLRHEMARFARRVVDATDGMNVQLALDMVVQHYAEAELLRIVENNAPKAATIIVSEPATGNVLALANYPSYDLNAFWEYEQEAMRNRAITDVFEPGSTFKIVAASGALNESLATVDSVFDCDQDAVEYHGRTVRLPGDHKRYGLLDFRDVIAKSSNRGAAQMGMLLGERSMYDYARSFGFGESTGLELDGEVRGVLHEVHRWDGLTISRLPIGHAVSATPLQVHFAMSVIANGGILMRPRVLERIYDAEGNTVVEFPPSARRRVVGEDTASLMAGLLVRTVSGEGTAPRAEMASFEVAGKTGTTQKIVNGAYSHRHHVSSFSGFFPARDPQLLITVVVDDAERPKPAYGGVVAAPAFRNVAQQLVQYLAIQPVESSATLVASNINPVTDVQ